MNKYNDHLMLILSLILVCITTSCNNETNTTAVPRENNTQKTVGHLGIVHEGIKTPQEHAPPCEQALIRKETAERMDKLDMLYSGRVEIDRHVSMLEIPNSMKESFGPPFTIAKTPPEIEFAIVPVEPKFLPVYNNQESSGWWGNYCQSNYDPSTGKFYSAVADHGAYDAHIYLVEYDSRAKAVTCLPELNESLGISRDQFGDGILHGWLDIYQSRHQTRPNLWFCTYWSKFPEPDEADYATGYDGGHIIRYDMESGDFVDYGAPLARASWPYHRVDTQRGMLYAVSYFNDFLAWDINEQKTVYAGHLPEGMKWYNRAIMLDETTGCVYTINGIDSDTERHIIKYDPATNRFSQLDCHMPKNSLTGTIDPMRAQTRHRGPDGLIWGITNSGELFAFDPEKETVTEKGINWPGDQRYTCSLERSPGGRYIYYQVQTYKDGSPVMQFDTQTGERKVLAFVRQYYYDKYGYIPAGSYSLKLNETGDKLFMLWNGAFMDYSDDIGVDRFGHCSVMVMNIPESERQENQ